MTYTAASHQSGCLSFGFVVHFCTQPAITSYGSQLSQEGDNPNEKFFLGRGNSLF